MIIRSVMKSFSIYATEENMELYLDKVILKKGTLKAIGTIVATKVVAPSCWPLFKIRWAPGTPKTYRNIEWLRSDDCIDLQRFIESTEKELKQVKTLYSKADALNQP